MSIDIQPEKQAAHQWPKNAPTLSPAPTKQPKGGVGWKRVLLAVGVLAVLAVVVVVVIRAVAPKRVTKVLTHPIARGDLVVSVTEEGTLESSSNTEIKCKVKGGSTVLWVIETGTKVKPGDELVKLDTSTIEDNISQQKILYENALANKTTTESDVEVAKIGITEYLEGLYEQERKTIENEIYLKEEDLKKAELSYESIKRSVSRGLVSQLQLQGEVFSVNAARKDLELSLKKLDVLDNYTKPKTLKELRSVLKAAEARFASDTEALKLEEARLKREENQLENCVIRAEVEGMVIYPSAAEWKEQPDIEEGATVREDQVLLIIPDLKQMQVKVGIHESKVDRLKTGMKARVELQDRSIDGEVFSIATITKPTGWWNGNVVKYDTIIKVAEQEGLKPGMSVAVEVFLARYNDVLMIPVAAVVEQQQEFFCWVETAEDVVQRRLKLGDSNDRFIVVEDGLKEGERVVLNPIDFVDEAKHNALRPIGSAESGQPKAKPGTDGSSPQKTDDELDKKPGGSQQKASTGAAILKLGDKNGDGVLTKDELDEKTKPHFESIDSNGNGEVDATELDAGLKKMWAASQPKS